MGNVAKDEKRAGVERGNKNEGFIQKSDIQTFVLIPQ